MKIEMNDVDEDISQEAVVSLWNWTSWDSQSSLEQVRVQTNHRAHQPAKVLNSVLAETFSPSSLVGGPAQFSATLILILALSLTAMWHLQVM